MSFNSSIFIFFFEHFLLPLKTLNCKLGFPYRYQQAQRNHRIRLRNHLAPPPVFPTFFDCLPILPGNQTWRKVGQGETLSNSSPLQQRRDQVYRVYRFYRVHRVQKVYRVYRVLQSFREFTEFTEFYRVLRVYGRCQSQFKVIFPRYFKRAPILRQDIQS